MSSSHSKKVSHDFISEPLVTINNVQLPTPGGNQEENSTEYPLPTSSSEVNIHLLDDSSYRDEETGGAPARHWDCLGSTIKVIPLICATLIV